MLKLLAFVLPLGLDSFATAAALGTAALPARQRWRISALFVIFEAGMPLIGLALGAPLAHAIGGIADYLAPPRCSPSVPGGCWLTTTAKPAKPRTCSASGASASSPWAWRSVSTNSRSASAWA
jgi:hypothetical protein